MSENHPEDYEEQSESQEELDRVPNVDNGEPLVDFVELCPQLIFAPVHPLFDFPRVHLVRQSVAHMLCEAACALPNGLRLQVVEGYRPIVSQRAMNRYMFDKFRRENPDWSDAQVQERANRF